MIDTAVEIMNETEFDFYFMRGVFVCLYVACNDVVEYGVERGLDIFSNGALFYASIFRFIVIVVVNYFCRLTIGVVSSVATRSAATSLMLSPVVVSISRSPPIIRLGAFVATVVATEITTVFTTIIIPAVTRSRPITRRLLLVVIMSAIVVYDGVIVDITIVFTPAEHTEDRRITGRHLSRLN